MPGERRERARNFLAYGFAISVAVHLIGLPLVHADKAVAPHDEPPPGLIIDYVATPPPIPPPNAIGPSAAPVAATPTPRPAPTPLSCARPDLSATTLRAAEPETPSLAQAQGVSVATHVQNSPSPLLDAAALAAARGSVFRTEVRNCEPVAADYLFSVEFSNRCAC
jgi:hypothetical protein